jgi:gliding motility-associated-like protein
LRVEKYIRNRDTGMKDLKSFISVIFFLVVSVMSFGQVASPEVKCLAVDAAGDVTVTWFPAADPTSVFIEYRIYADNGGGFIQVGTESVLGVSSFIHLGANANASSLKYLVTSFSTAESAAQDTLSTIFLSVNNPGDGTALLIWNEMSTPALITAGNWYLIYQEYPTNVWTLIDSTQYGAETYRDTITLCNETINYRIELEDNSGCNSVSNIDGDVLQDLMPPDAPIIDWVTVDTATGDAVINWTQSNSIDASGYIILEFISGGWVIIDTVYGYTNTNYTNLNAFVDFQPENYGVAAFDSCSNTSPMGVPQNSMYASTSLDICEKEVTINWNAYQNWSTGLLRYEVYASSGGPYTLISSLASSETSYIHTGVLGNTWYCYVIRAVNVGETSSSISNKVCRFVKQPPLPQFAYIQAVTVVSDGEIEVRFHPDVSAIVNSYTLERTDNLANPFDVVSLSTGGGDPIVFNDYNVSADNKSYYYQVVLEDSCGRSSLISNIGRSILLTVTENITTLVNLLQWTKYENWDGSIMEYRIYRSVNGVYDSSPIATIPSSQSFYQDDIGGLVTNKITGEFCYYIEAVENVNNYGIAETSLSNRACVNHDPIVYVPNGLFIGGINNTWKPVVSLLDFSSYDVKVLGRQGHIVFSSTDANQEWDGSYKGEYVPIDVYIYQLTFVDAEGQFYEFSGHITVVR